MNFYPPKKYGDKCAQSRTSLFICDDCKQATTLEDVLTDEGFAEIVQKFKSVNKVPPDRARTKLVFYPLNKFNYPVTLFESYESAPKQKTIL